MRYEAASDSPVDTAGIRDWIRSRVKPTGAIEIVHIKPWATVARVPIAGGTAWFKACAPVQAFEARLTAELFGRWPDRVAEVLACDEDRAWLLLGDAGAPIGSAGNPPEAWLAALPRYAELQRGEASRADDHLAHGVPDLRLATLPARYEQLLQIDLPLAVEEVRQLHGFAARFTELCADLAACGIPETVQHDDLHHANLYDRAGRLRVLDWGDASISHPFASLVVTFRFLEEVARLRPGDQWFTRLRDAYLEPWGAGLSETFAMAFRVGSFARAMAYVPLRATLTAADLLDFDSDFAIVLRRALAQADRVRRPPRSGARYRAG